MTKPYLKVYFNPAIESLYRNLVTKFCKMGAAYHYSYLPNITKYINTNILES